MAALHSELVTLHSSQQQGFQYYLEDQQNSLLHHGSFAQVPFVQHYHRFLCQGLSERTRMAVDETLAIPWPADDLTEADCQDMERLCLTQALMWKAAAASASIQSTSAASLAGKPMMVVCNAALVICVQCCHLSIAIRVLRIVCQHSCADVHLHLHVLGLQSVVPIIHDYFGMLSLGVRLVLVTSLCKHRMFVPSVILMSC